MATNPAKIAGLAGHESIVVRSSWPNSVYRGALYKVRVTAIFLGSRTIHGPPVAVAKSVIRPPVRRISDLKRLPEKVDLRL
jgi:hypothetical protein